MVITIEINKGSCPLQNQSLTPKAIYEATVVNSSDDENRYTLALQIQPLRSDIATLHKILIMSVSLNVESFRSTFGN